MQHRVVCNIRFGEKIWWIYTYYEVFSNVDVNLKYYEMFRSMVIYDDCLRDSRASSFVWIDVLVIDNIWGCFELTHASNDCDKYQPEE